VTYREYGEYLLKDIWIAWEKLSKVDCELIADSKEDPKINKVLLVERDSSYRAWLNAQVELNTLSALMIHENISWEDEFTS
jgi:hypothetical protein